MTLMPPAIIASATYLAALAGYSDNADFNFHLGSKIGKLAERQNFYFADSDQKCFVYICSSRKILKCCWAGYLAVDSVSPANAGVGKVFSDLRRVKFKVVADVSA